MCLGHYVTKTVEVIHDRVKDGIDRLKWKNRFEIIEGKVGNLFR